jgi:metallo-beta-lactamase family protein
MLPDSVVSSGDVVTYIREFEDFAPVASPQVIMIASTACATPGGSCIAKETGRPRCTIILVSYQAKGTTGRRLLEKTPTVKFLGKDWNKWLEVVHLDGFSGHADRADFLAYLSPLANHRTRVRLIHGEREQAEALAETLREAGFDDVDVPSPGDSVELGT